MFWIIILAILFLCLIILLFKIIRSPAIKHLIEVFSNFREAREVRNRKEKENSIVPQVLVQNGIDPEPANKYCQDNSIRHNDIRLELDNNMALIANEHANYEDNLARRFILPKISVSLIDQVEKENEELDISHESCHGYLQVPKLSYLSVSSFKSTMPLDPVEARELHEKRCKILEATRKENVTNRIAFKHLDHPLIVDACCDNVGYSPIPLSWTGPLLLNDNEYLVPMVTPDICILDLVNRGCKALLISGGVWASDYDEGMTRAPVVQFVTTNRAFEAMKWLRMPDNYNKVKLTFDNTSVCDRLERIETEIAGRYLFIRFVGVTGDAMATNRVSKGIEEVFKLLTTHFPDIERTCLSGNLSIDEKGATPNIEGGGKFVVCEAFLKDWVLSKEFNTSVPCMVEMNQSRNLMDRSAGGYYRQAIDVVTPLYLACGKDPAQNISSANYITVMKQRYNSLHVMCRMPLIEVGTPENNTMLSAHTACLKIMGAQGSTPNSVNNNSRALSSLVCATVLAAELSYVASLAKGTEAVVDSKENNCVHVKINEHDNLKMVKKHWSLRNFTKR